MATEVKSSDIIDDLCNRFRNNIGQLSSMAGISGILYNLINDEKDTTKSAKLTEARKLFELADGVVKEMSIKKIIDGYIKYSYTGWDYIFAKDRKYFLAHADSMFQDLPGANVEVFKMIAKETKSDGTYKVSDKALEKLFSYFQNMVKISIKYLHHLSSPVPSANGTYAYIKLYKPEGLTSTVTPWLDLPGLIAKYKVDLTK